MKVRKVLITMKKNEKFLNVHYQAFTLLQKYKYVIAMKKGSKN